MDGNKMQLIEFNHYTLIFSDEKSCVASLLHLLNFKYSANLFNELSSTQVAPKITIPQLVYMLYQLTIEDLPNLIDNLEIEAQEINTLSFNLSINERYCYFQSRLHASIRKLQDVGSIYRLLFEGQGYLYQ